MFEKFFGVFFNGAQCMTNNMSGIMGPTVSVSVIRIQKEDV